MSLQPVLGEPPAKGCKSPATWLVVSPSNANILMIPLSIPQKEVDIFRSIYLSQFKIISADSEALLVLSAHIKILITAVVTWLVVPLLNENLLVMPFSILQEEIGLSRSLDLSQIEILYSLAILVESQILVVLSAQCSNIFLASQSLSANLDISQLKILTPLKIPADSQVLLVLPAQCFFSAQCQNIIIAQQQKRKFDPGSMARSIIAQPLLLLLLGSHLTIP
jgi:hypothetical protein